MKLIPIIRRKRRQLLSSFGRALTIHDVKITVRKNYSRIIRSALINGTYEHSEAKLVQKHVRTDDIVIDIGGGIGCIGCLAAKKAYLGHVFAVEANPEVLSDYSANIQLNKIKNATLLNAVLSDADGVCDFYVSHDFWASSLTPCKNLKKKIIVPKLNVESFIQKTKPTVILLDIEGGEFDLLANPVFKNLEAPLTIICEMHRPQKKEEYTKISWLWDAPYKCSMRLPSLKKHLIRHDHQTLIFSKVE